MPGTDPSWGVTTTTVNCAVAAALTAASLAYVFGPSIIPSPEDEKLQKRSTGPVVLTNSANDCFINSVLQALAGSCFLRSYLHAVCTHTGPAHEHEVAESNAPDGRDAAATRNDSFEDTGILTSALNVNLDRLHDISISKRVISPRHFIRSLEQAFHSRLSRKQQDAHELIQAVAEKLDDESQLRHRVDQGLSDPPPSGSLSVPSLPKFPMRGVLESQVECLTCRYQPPAKRHGFAVLTLNVPRESSTTLDQCLDGLLKQEAIDDYKCDKCCLIHHVKKLEKDIAKANEVDSKALRNQLSQYREVLEGSNSSIEAEVDASGIADAPKRKISRYTRLVEYPPLLVLHLSRSIFYPGNVSSRNDAKVSFQEHLALGGFDRHDYKLTSLITHRGGHNSGHYEAFRRQAQPAPQAEAEAHSSADTAKSHGERHSSPGLASAREMRRTNNGAAQIADRWWGISDDRYNSCRTADLLSKQADVYLLLYELQSPRIT